MTNITIGKGLTWIGDWAFLYCAQLKSVHFRGDRPVFLSSGLLGGSDATIYYLPGTAGWGQTFDGHPTAFWSLPNPVLLDFGSGFGVSSNGFGLVVSWATNVPVVVEAAPTPDASAWSPIATNTLREGVAYLSDTGWTNSRTRFYRVRAE